MNHCLLVMEFVKRFINLMSPWTCPVWVVACWCFCDVILLKMYKYWKKKNWSETFFKFFVCVSHPCSLCTHSSPSFRSQHKSSYSNLIRKCDRSMVRCWNRSHLIPQAELHFHCMFKFGTLTLASMLDSLVCVSRQAV